MDLQIKGKKAIVTGSTAGIGLAIATALVAEGADVVINGRTQKRVDEALAAIKKSVPSGIVSGIAADLGTAEGAAAFLKQAPDADILVNNLGIFEVRPFAQIADGDWMRFFEVNVMSGVRMSRAYLPGMQKKNWGRIVFISSESAYHIPAEMVHYGMTKSAQIAVARGLAETVAGTGITVNSVLPGPTRSEGVETFVGQVSGGKSFGDFEHEFFEKVRPNSLIKRFETVEEIASVVAFVCSPLGAGIHGSALRVEGGCIKSAY